MNERGSGRVPDLDDWQEEPKQMSVGFGTQGQRHLEQENQFTEMAGFAYEGERKT